MVGTWDHNVGSYSVPYRIRVLEIQRRRSFGFFRRRPTSKIGSPLGHLPSVHLLAEGHVQHLLHLPWRHTAIGSLFKFERSACLDEILSRIDGSLGNGDLGGRLRE